MNETHIVKTFSFDGNPNILKIPDKYTDIIDMYMKHYTLNSINMTNTINTYGCGMTGITVRKIYSGVHGYYQIKANSFCFHLTKYACYFVKKIIDWIMMNHYINLSLIRYTTNGIITNSVINKIVDIDSQCYIMAKNVLSKLQKYESMPILICKPPENFIDNFVTALYTVSTMDQKKYPSIWNNLSFLAKKLDPIHTITNGVSNNTPTIAVFNDMYSSYLNALTPKTFDCLAKNKTSLCNALDSLADIDGMISIYVIDKTYDELEKERKEQDKVNVGSSIGSFYRAGRIKSRIMFDNIVNIVYQETISDDIETEKFTLNDTFKTPYNKEVEIMLPEYKEDIQSKEDEYIKKIAQQTNTKNIVSLSKLVCKNHGEYKTKTCLYCEQEKYTNWDYL
jgi:hypothetical protein